MWGVGLAAGTQLRVGREGGNKRWRVGMRTCVYRRDDLCYKDVHPGKRNTMLLSLRITIHFCKASDLKSLQKK